MAMVAQRLVTLCATLGEFPHVRFAADGGGRAEGVARTFQARMEEFVSNTPQWNFRGQDTLSRSGDGGRATLLLVDRCEDTLSPLMHDFTYQCLVQDVLDVQDDRISYMVETGKGLSKKDVLLNDQDDLWAEFRHEHIGKVLNDLGNRFRELVKNSSGAASLVKGGGREMSLEAMATATRDLPAFQELSKKMSQHIKIAQQCMSKVDKLNLLKIGALEQTMALGKDELGTSRSHQDLLGGWTMDGERQPGLLEIMRSSSATPEMKMRLAGVFTQTQRNLTVTEKRNILGAASLPPSLVKALENLDVLGFGARGSQQGRGGSAPKKRRFKFGFGTSKSTEEESDYTHMRPVAPPFFSYHTPLKTTIDKLATDELSLEEFPSLLPMPATQKRSEPRSIRKAGKGGPHISGAYGGARVMVFVIGGVCYSELRGAYECMHTHGREVIVGGTGFLSPNDYVQGLRGL
ncbi:unnamed protein product [Discosporangium mesarthrocarpum]